MRIEKQLKIIFDINDDYPENNFINHLGNGFLDQLGNVCNDKRIVAHLAITDDKNTYTFGISGEAKLRSNKPPLGFSRPIKLTES